MKNLISEVIKRELILEKAGISEVVRRWAKILKREVEEQLAEHRKSEFAKTKKDEPAKTEKDFNNEKAYNGPGIDDDPKQLDIDFPSEGEVDKNDPFYWEDETSKGKGSKGTNWDDYDEWESRFRYDKKGNWWKKNRGGKDYYKKGESKKEEPKKEEGSYPGYGTSYGGRYGGGGYGGYGGYSYTPQPYIKPLDEVVVYGDSFPEEFAEFSVDMWVMKNSSRIEYDHYESGYAESGEYIVYLNVPLAGMSETAFIHEIKHAYDDWNRMSHGGKPIRDSWEIKNIYTKDFEKLILGQGSQFTQLGPIVRYFYLGSKLEMPAYLENEYDNTMIDYEDVGKKLMKFKASNYLDKRGNPARGVEEEFTSIKKFDIPLFKKFNNVVEFLYWTEKYFNKRGKDIFRRVTKMRYVHGLPEKFKSTYVYTPGMYNKPTTATTTPASTIENDDEEFGGWKYTKDKGWHQVEEEPKKENKKIETEFKDGDTMDGWKYSQERGWYFDPEVDEDQENWMR